MNFDGSTAEYLQTNSRGQGRGRIKEDDLLNMPIPEIEVPESIIELHKQLTDKQSIDVRLLEKVKKLNGAT